MATITNKFVISIICLVLSANALCQPSKSGLPTNLPLVEKAIPMPDGDVRPILAVAVQQGQALGVLTGNAAKQISQKFGVESKVYVRATKMRELFEGCPKVVAKYYQLGTPNEYEIAFKVCPK